MDLVQTPSVLLLIFVFSNAKLSTRSGGRLILKNWGPRNLQWFSSHSLCNVQFQNLEVIQLPRPCRYLWCSQPMVEINWNWFFFGIFLISEPGHEKKPTTTKRKRWMDDDGRWLINKVQELSPQNLKQAQVSNHQNGGQIEVKVLRCWIALNPKRCKSSMWMVTDGRVMALMLENHEGGSFSLGGKSFSHQVVDKLRSSFVFSLFLGSSLLPHNWQIKLDSNQRQTKGSERKKIHHIKCSFQKVKM